jgi:hypothetical protein
MAGTLRLGDGLAGRIREALLAAQHGDAFIDTYGEDYVQLAINELGVEPSCVDTFVRFDALDKYGAKAEGNAVGTGAPGRWHTWPSCSSTATSRCRSPRATRWTRCARPTPG